VDRLLSPSGPQRALILSSFVNRVGNGLFNTASALYFTLVVHLQAAEVGIGLTIAGIIGLLAGIPAGDLADRHGPRLIRLLALTAQTATMIGYLFVHSFGLFVLFATVGQLSLSAGGAAAGPMIVRAGGDRPGAFRAKVRTYGNLGVVVGTVGAGIAVAIGSRSAYEALVLGNAASYVLCGLLVFRLPNYAPLPKPAHQRRFASLTDRPFVVFTALYGAMGLQYPVLSLLLPLWIVRHTDAPHWTVAGIAGLSACVCVLLQVRLGAGVETPSQGGKAFRRAGLLFLLSCPLLAVTADVPGWVAILVMFVAVVLHSIAEVWESSAAFALGFGLAPDHAQGQYQGLLGLGFDVGQAVAPAILTTVVLGLGQAGWVLLGVFFVGLGLAGPPLAAWAERTRPAVSGTTAR
jgi:MFS family permease